VDHHSLRCRRREFTRGWCADNSAYASFLPKIVANQTNMAGFQASINVQNYRLMFLWVTVPGLGVAPSQFNKNLVYGMTATSGASWCNTTNPWSFVPNSIACPSGIDGSVNDVRSVQFVNLVNHDYHPKATSPGYHAARDGKDVGADIDAVNTATAGVIQGIPPVGPPPPPSPPPAPVPGPACKIVVTWSDAANPNGTTHTIYPALCK
jgi:hypothetical protein